MGKTKKQQPVWAPFLKGTALSLLLYLLGQLLLALLVVKGILGEGTAFPVTAALAFLSTAAGSLLPARRSPWGTLPGGLLSAAAFAVVLIAGGALWWDGITWTGHGGVLLCCVLGGGVAAGLLGGRKGKRRRR
ncbi:TIGR04086 family membrane protein [Oscillibacter sp.]|uniref:TIGR04086 family membrane protein n=1 Tax=Oscillibacter sp. TaxID=1945593 RepID=UPI0026357815|nr:TIGR04086 family membrane protein [Oscillibacter sp.]MDD3347948.1 TIGR04086 family membrane protein [Oscillibacter sp.]